MKHLTILLFVFFMLFLLLGCSQIKYQCQDGTVKESANDCSNTFCPNDCPELNCNPCPIQKEIKIVTEKVYVCSDLTEVKSINECKTEEQKYIESTNSDLVISINDARSANLIGQYSLENLSLNEHYLIIDFSIYNKGLEEGYEFNPNWILVEDNKGYSYSYSWDSSQLSKYWGGMTGVTVEFESKKSGELAFVVPKSENEFTLVVRDFLGTRGRKSFNLN
jgi:hypothetical protein